MAKKKKRPDPPSTPVRHKAPRPAAPTGRTDPRQAVSRAAAKRRLIAGGLAAAALVAVAAYVIDSRRGDAELRTALTAGSCEVDSKADGKTTATGHVPDPTYTVEPPAGGNHNPGAARGGVYAGTSVPDDGLLVHSLEHGYVVAWHRPDLPAAQQAQLESFEQRHQGDVIVVERAGLPVRIAATSWGQRLLCDSVEPDVLDRFAERYIGKGPENVPRG